MTENCGEPTADGTPCQRPEGFGREADTGPCMDHVEERPVLRKFTPQRRERIVGAASSGAYKKHIAQMAEIDPDTLERWIDMGRTDEENGLDTDLAEFYTDWQRARGVGAIQKLQNVDDEFILERSYGYTKTEEHKLEHSGEVEGSLFELPPEVTDNWSDGDE